MNLNRREFLVGSMVAAIARPAFSENDVAGATDEGVPPAPQFTVGGPRADIASAKFKVVFCHIPLYAAPDSGDYPHDGEKIDPQDYAYWSRECAELWGPLLDRHGVQLVVAGHRHLFRYDPPAGGRKWAQVLGGGPELGVHNGQPDAGKFPTVVEGFVDEGRLRVVVHDVFNKRVALDVFV